MCYKLVDTLVTWAISQIRYSEVGFSLGIFQRALSLLGAPIYPLGLSQNQHILNSHLNYVLKLSAL